jgi:hypothetical protein
MDVRTLTSGPNHHFFGYYSVCPWNHSQTHLLCIESTFQDHLPAPEEGAVIGLVDAATGVFDRITETHAWNLQQGAMLHWITPDTGFVHNDRMDGEIVSVIHNVKTGQRRILPRPVNAVSSNGRYALSLTYGRLQRMRKVVGYVGTVDPNPDEKHPDNDGVFLMDLQSGETRLVVSIKQVFDMLVERHPMLREKDMWFNHVGFNRDDTRFFFLGRCWEDGELQTGMFTASLDGTDLREVVPFGTRVSHFEWRDANQIIFTSDFRGRGREHVLVTDGDSDFRLVAEGDLNFDGHMTFSPDRNWLVTDQNVLDGLEKWLLLVRMRDESVSLLHRFPMLEPRFLVGDLRCDLHPRWNRSGDAICVDALNPHDGTRQLHVVTVPFTTP